MARTAEPRSSFHAVVVARTRVAFGVTAATVVIYFGFLLLVSFNKPLLGALLVPGLSLGILLAALVIVLAWVLTLIFVLWANRHYDSAIDELRQ